MRCWLVILIAQFGCRGDAPTPPSKTTQADPPTAPAAADPATAPTSPDPWAVATPVDPDDPPNLFERHRLANQACPTVTAPYFYRIEKAGKVSHILGTRHIGVSLAKFPPVVHDALKTAKLVVFEVAPGDDSELPQEMISLPDALGPKLWAHYRTLVGAAVADADQRTTPATAAIMMIAMYEDISAMLDEEIERQVVAAGIPTAGLEPSALQDKVINEVLDLRALRASIQTTETRQELADESQKDLAKYCAGVDEPPGIDAEGRAELLSVGYTKAEVDHIDDVMLYKRNASWIPELEKILAQGDAFIAVGAGHFPGPRGVIALLAARGFTLTRVAK
jgi:uncharacterized protein YbaP (TraB family)